MSLEPGRRSVYLVSADTERLDELMGATGLSMSRAISEAVKLYHSAWRAGQVSAPAPRDPKNLELRKQAASLRAANGWSNTKIARYMGLNRNTVGRWLRSPR